VVGAQSGVMNDLAANQVYVGTPSYPHRESLRMVAAFPKLPEMRKTLIEIEKRLKKIEEALSLGEKEK
jgi:UDP-3-O-[3-hydroxymyristoyl] glucosamine N-acyltransferase